MGITDNYISIMIESLRRKRGILSDIVNKNIEQNTFLKSAEFDVDLFQNSMEEKAVFIDRLNELDEGFDLLYTRVKEELDNRTELYKESILCMKELIKEITDYSITIQRGELENKTLFERQLIQLKKDIQEARRSTSTADKYYKTMSRIDFEPQFMDKKK